jgi:ABC-type transport system involved in cytochrome c biogenesis permease subunit
VTLGLVLVGGLFFGALVAKAAFGAYWGGWPNGRDLTDNKTLIMAAAWLAACLLLCAAKAGRAAVLAASALTILVYLVPHSLQAAAGQGDAAAPAGEPGGQRDGDGAAP